MDVALGISHPGTPSELALFIYPMFRQQTGSPGALQQLRQPRAAILKQRCALCVLDAPLNALSWTLPSDVAAATDAGGTASC